MTHIPIRQSTKGGFVCGSKSISLKKIPVPPSTLVANQIIGITTPIKKVLDTFKGMGLLETLSVPKTKKARTDDNIKFIF